MRAEYLYLTGAYLLLATAGAVLAYWYGKNTRRFYWSEYWAMLAAPLLGVAALAYWFGFQFIYVFFFGALFLATLEWFTGFAYHNIMGARLWRYERHALPGGYTSYLTLPIWGSGMVLLWLIMKSF